MADPYGSKPPLPHHPHSNDSICPPYCLKRPFPPCLPPESSPHVPFRPIDPVDNNFRKAYYWVDTNARGGVPSTALEGGEDIDGHRIYVGRAYFQGDWIPAKVIPGKNVAYVAYDGAEHDVDNFQVLCEQRFDWVDCHDGEIPSDAVQGGKTADGEPLYIGRAEIRGAKTVGKIHPSHKVCYIPFDGKEEAFSNYEILVLRP